MIFPILRGIVNPFRAPITFVLFALNVLVFGATFEMTDEVDRRFDALLMDRTFLETQGLAFSKMIEKDSVGFSETMRTLSLRALGGDRDSQKIMGGFAIRNVEFMDRAQTFKFEGDQVALEDWREKFAKFREAQAEHPSYAWGLSRLKNDWSTYITYQFAHAGLLHLFWNMIFLLVFGCFIETKVGGSQVALTYIGAGIWGAIVHSFMSGISGSPLVGASAAVSGLIAFVGINFLGREKVRFFYWLLPLEGYFGAVLLPSWLILFVSLLPDISGYLGAPDELRSVAYTAHIGGAIWGTLLAVMQRGGWLVNETESNDSATPLERSVS